MSAQSSRLQLQRVTTHDVRHYSVDLKELLEHLEQTKRTGVVILHINEGRLCKLEFENRVKEIKKVY